MYRRYRRTLFLGWFRRSGGNGRGCMFGSFGRARKVAHWILDLVVSTFQTNGGDFREAICTISALIRIHNDKHADQRQVCGQRPKQPPFRGGSEQRDPTGPRLRSEVRQGTQKVKPDILCPHARTTASTSAWFASPISMSRCSRPRSNKFNAAIRLERASLCDASSEVDGRNSLCVSCEQNSGANVYAYLS